MYMTARYELVEEEYQTRRWTNIYTGAYSKKYTIEDAKVFDNPVDAVAYAKELGHKYHAYVVQLRVGYPPNVIYESDTED